MMTRFSKAKKIEAANSLLELSHTHTPLTPPDAQEARPSLEMLLEAAELISAGALSGPENTTTTTAPQQEVVPLNERDMNAPPTVDGSKSVSAPARRRPTTKVRATPKRASTRAPSPIEVPKSVPAPARRKATTRPEPKAPRKRADENTPRNGNAKRRKAVGEDGEVVAVDVTPAPAPAPAPSARARGAKAPAATRRPVASTSRVPPTPAGTSGPSDTTVPRKRGRPTKKGNVVADTTPASASTSTPTPGPSSTTQTPPVVGADMRDILATAAAQPAVGLMTRAMAKKAAQAAVDAA